MWGNKWKIIILRNQKKTIEKERKKDKKKEKKRFKKKSRGQMEIQIFVYKKN